MMNKRYQKEWDRLLESAREAIKIASNIESLMGELRQNLRDEEFRNIAKEVIQHEQEEYSIVTEIIYNDLKFFKNKKIKIVYKEGFWKENAMLFIIADSFSKIRSPIYLNPNYIYKEESIELFLKEIQDYVGEEIWSKYLNFIKCGFVSAYENEYLEELILPC